MIADASSPSNDLRILFARSAIELIGREALQTPGTETGGILVGRRLDANRILILAATEPGPNADRRATTFAPDIDYVEQQLGILRRQYPGTNFVGTWHKHPASLDRPSGGDLLQAREMLADPAYAVKELVAPIVVVRRGCASLKAYHLRRAAANESDFVFVNHESIADEDAEDLLRESREKGMDRYKARLVQELKLLQAAYPDSKALQQPGSDAIVFSVPLEKRTVYLSCSPFFPSAAPTLILDPQDEATQSIASQVMAGWTSHRQLVEVVREATARLAGKEPEQPVPSHLVPIGRPRAPQGVPDAARFLPSPGPVMLAGALALALLLAGTVLVVLLGDYLGKRDGQALTEKPRVEQLGSTFSSDPAEAQLDTPEAAAPEADKNAQDQGTEVSSSSPAAPSTSTLAASTTLTPTAEPTAMPTLVLTPTPTDLEDQATTPEVRLVITEGLSVYLDGQTYQGSVAISADGCFTISFGVSNKSIQAYHVHGVGAAVRSALQEPKLLEWPIDPAVILPSGEWNEIQLPGSSEMLCWSDLGMPVLATLTLVPRIRYSLGPVSCDVQPSECYWYEFNSADSLEIMLQQ